jgi:hypothetical protein
MYHAAKIGTLLTHCTNVFYVILLLTALTDGVFVMETHSVWRDKEIGFLNSISMSFTIQGAETNHESRPVNKF